MDNIIKYCQNLFSIKPIDKGVKKANYNELISASIRSYIAYLHPDEFNDLCNINIEIISDELHEPPNPSFIDKNSNEEFKNILIKKIKEEITNIEDLKFISSPIKSGHDCNLYLWIKNDILYISIRGTSSFEDIIADLTCIPAHYKDNIYIHKGFLDQFKSVEAMLTEQIKKYENIKNIVFSGHSLGSGISQIASAYYGEMFPEKIISCFTFGCPRTGNINFVKWFSKNVKTNVRVANIGDPITMIPEMYYWEHTFDDCIVLDDMGSKFCFYDVPWYYRFIYLFYRLDYLNPAYDHSFDLYILRLIKLGNNSD